MPAGPGSSLPPTLARMLTPLLTHAFVSMKIYELDGIELKLLKDVEKPQSFKCGTFGASSIADRRLATGNFGGQLEIWDLERTEKPLFQAQAHASIINAMDGCGGQV